MTTVAPGRLRAHLKDKLDSVYLLSGDEPLQLGEAADAVRAAARKQGFADRDVLFADARFDWSKLSASGANLSLFAEKRILEVRLPTGKPGKQGGTALSEFVADPPADTLLLVISGKVDKRVSWVKNVQRAGVHTEIWPLSRSDLPGWISRRMSDAGLNCSRAAADLLADRVEGNLLAADQEIRKLRLSHGAGEIDAETLIQSVADSSRYDVFKLSDAVLLGDAERALRVIQGLRSEGVALQLVLWALGSAAREIVKIRAVMDEGMGVDAAMRKLRVWSNRQQILKSAVQRNSLPVVYSILEQLADADLASKGHGPGEPWAMLSDIACELAGKPAVSWPRAS